MPSPLMIIVFLIVLLCTGTYIQYGTTTITTSQEHTFSFEPVIPVDDIISSDELPPVPATIIDEACSKVDFQWLAGDRSFWDGWSSKAMFMKSSGRFTRKNVRAIQGESVCITVLLGPIPAVSSIKVMSHYAPSDTIVMTAKGKNTGSHIPITLKQHPKQLNAYFASVQFNHDDQYTLDTSVDYRSYFWEFPQRHQYLPNKFSSSNHLTVLPFSAEKEREECNLARNPFAFHQGAWMDKQYYLQEIDSDERHFINTDSDLVFEPNCKVLSKKGASALDNLTVHAWGDVHLKRNIELLKGYILPTDSCNHREEKFDVYTPISIMNTQLYYGEINANMADKVNEYKRHIDGITNDLPHADVVLLGVGNNDVAASRQSPNDFASSFNSLLNYLLSHVYTKGEKIIVKTTQYYGSYGPNQGWNHGRSEAYANIIRYTALQSSPQNRQRVFLWDIHGLSENSVDCYDKYMSSYPVLQVENAMLDNLFQQIL